MEAAQEKTDKEFDILNSCITNDFNVQSKSVSDNARKVVWAILAALGVLCYKNGAFCIQNVLFSVSGIGSFIYLAIDLLHYYIDSVFLFKKRDRLFHEKCTHDNLVAANAVLHEHTHCSFIFLGIKVIIAFLISALFIVGLFYMQ